MATGGSKALVSKGISFGTIARAANGSWDLSKVEGIPAVSLTTSGPADPPSLIIRPFHQAGRVVSLREFTNNAFNHHSSFIRRRRATNLGSPRSGWYAGSIFKLTIE